MWSVSAIAWAAMFVGFGLGFLCAIFCASARCNTCEWAEKLDENYRDYVRCVMENPREVSLEEKDEA